MKKIVSILMAVGLFCTTVSAQKLISTNGDSRFGKKMTTTDSLYHYIDSFTVNANECGIVEFCIVGLDTAGKNSVIKGFNFGYTVKNGTATVRSYLSTTDLFADAALTGSDADIVISGTKVKLRLRGKPGINVLWYSTLRRKAIFKG